MARDEAAEFVDRSTRSQGTSKTWQEMTPHHITSSNYGTVCKASGRRDVDGLTDTLTTHCTTAILRGRKYEFVAIERFEALRGVKTIKCGLFISRRICCSSSVHQIRCYSLKIFHITTLSMLRLRAEL